MSETRARDLANVGVDATGLATDAELSSGLASKVDYALPVNAQTGTTYTFVLADAEKLTTASNAAAVTLTIPPQSSVTWLDNTVLRVVNYGAGAVTVDGGSGVTVTNTATTIAQYGAAVAIRTGSDAWTLVPFGGGDEVWATISSPSATGNYTDGDGVEWNYYSITSNSNVTFDTDGLIDLFMIGGGQYWGFPDAGSGGRITRGRYLVTAGTQAVVVGAAGTDGGNTSLGSNITARIHAAYAGFGAGAGWDGTNARTSGYVSNITGSNVTYGVGSNSGTASGYGSAGQAGIVIIRVKA